ncbi:MAG: hypothetical protein AUJ85_07685 [Elusimicrobia bacterium CG1_02_37_114]|nr:MAG: hypothetical protein AUJ85_07685 [Elusimicrobia bacterium CG1_02_37_114]
METKKETKENLAKKLSWWQESDRDDQKVAEEMYKTKKVNSIHNLEETRLLDEFYKFTEEIGVIELLKKITPIGVKRVMVPFFQFVLLYMLKTLFGVESMCSSPLK